MLDAKWWLRFSFLLPVVVLATIPVGIFGWILFLLTSLGIYFYEPIERIKFRSSLVLWVVLVPLTVGFNLAGGLVLALGLLLLTSFYREHGEHTSFRYFLSWGLITTLLGISWLILPALLGELVLLLAVGFLAREALVFYTSFRARRLWAASAVIAFVSLQVTILGDLIFSDPISAAGFVGLTGLFSVLSVIKAEKGELSGGQLASFFLVFSLSLVLLYLLPSILVTK
jgi:hypothetical protein